MRRTIAVLVTLDTKGREAEFLRAEIEDYGCSALLVDIGVVGEPSLHADVKREEVAAAGGKSLSELLSKLSHPDRIRIVEELRAAEHDVNHLAETLELPHARVSQHLSVLRAQRIVRKRREGRRAYYELRNRDLARWLMDGLDFLEARIRESEEIRTSVEEVRGRYSD